MFDIYSGTGQLVATVVYPEDGAALLSAGYLDGSIRTGRNVLWSAKDGDPSESYDHVAEVVYNRLDILRGGLA